MTRGSHDPAPIQPPAKVRIEWIDAARGLCVVAVVLFHVGLWHFLRFEHESSVAFTFWDAAATALGSVRMPLLLAVSGILAASKVRNGFGNGKAWNSSLSNYYLYAVWLLIYALLSIVVANSPRPQRVVSIGDFFLQLIAPDTPLWFVFALAVYVPLLAFCRKLPPLVVLAALAALSILTALFVDSTAGQWGKVPELAVFFAAGVYGKDLFLQIAGTRRMLYFASAVPVFLALMALPDTHPGIDQAVYIVQGLAAATALVAFISAVTRYRPIAAAGSWVGRRTLGIYLLHTPIMDLLILAFHGPLSPLVPAISKSAPIALLYPLVLTGAVVAACVGVEYLLKKCGLTFLFQRPGSVPRPAGSRAHLLSRL
ncbi:putative membrane protein YcfT [Pseudarthrobacter defluvii]|uniref:acyltransferase family protein n=1 Tax=Pseudarthrobacter defluvii TaxID=410837 RepID=UPI00277D2BE9|nr:acyltransferase [Pseudarthrobacter defluvii]MDQ0768606.1 putative membrane protein YcfT [Pseudarthrobacter defluvii]